MSGFYLPKEGWNYEGLTMEKGNNAAIKRRGKNRKKI
jgi:hypothetical protein